MAGRGGLPGPGGAAEDGVSRAAALEGGADKEGKFPDMGVAVMKVFRDERGIEDLAVAKERLVVAKDVFLPHTYAIRERKHMSPRRAG